MVLVNWLPLAVGLAFGLIPPSRLINCTVRHMPFDMLWTDVLWRKNRDEDARRRRRWWKLPLVWIDPVRGYVVGAALLQAFEPMPGSNFVQAQLPALALGAVLFVVFRAQTQERMRERESISPASFVFGYMWAVFDPLVAGGAALIGAATSVSVRNYTAGYLLAMLVAGGLGGLLMGTTPKVAVLALGVGAPALLNWMRGTQLVTPVRC